MSDSHDLTGQIATPAPTPAGRRAQATRLLPAIADRTRAALAEANIDIDVFFVVPASGKAILSFGTVAEPDPPQATWDLVSQTVCRIVGEAVEMKNLQTCELPCIAARTTAPA